MAYLNNMEYLANMPEKDSHLLKLGANIQNVVNMLKWPLTHDVLPPVLEYVSPWTKGWKYHSDPLSESILSVFTSLDSVTVNILIPCDGQSASA